MSDGNLYPAINRLERAGLLTRQREPGAAAAPRHTLSLTEAGRDELRRRLREPAELDVTDQNRFFTLLAFLGQLANPAAQAAVLQRRLDFLDQPASFFYTGERPSAPRTRPTGSAAACWSWPGGSAGRSGPGCGRPSPSCGQAG